MACYTHCTGHCYNDQCSTYVAGLPDYVFLPAGVGQTITDEQITELRTVINTERSRRSMSNYSFSCTGFGDGFPIYGDGAPIGVADNEEQYMQLKESINQIAVRISSPYTQGVPVDADDIAILRAEINRFRRQCICNTDCGLDKTCSCYTNCACRYGYSGCETNVPCITWSDERLKEDIRSL